MNNNKIIDLYSNVAEITHEMLMAARHDDWDSLVDLEARCAQEVSVLKESDGNEALSPSERQEKITLINKILSHDREIRDLIHPRLAQLSALIGSAGNQRKLSHAYNTGNMG